MHRIYYQPCWQIPSHGLFTNIQLQTFEENQVTQSLTIKLLIHSLVLIVWSDTFIFSLVRLGMSSAGNCKQINIVSRSVSNNTQREGKYLDEDFFCEAFDHTWSGKLGIGFASPI
jgi:hypothetical protein